MRKIVNYSAINIQEGNQMKLSDIYPDCSKDITKMIEENKIFERKLFLILQDLESKSSSAILSEKIDCKKASQQIKEYFKISRDVVNILKNLTLQV